MAHTPTREEVLAVVDRLDAEAIQAGYGAGMFAELSYFEHDLGENVKPVLDELVKEGKLTYDYEQPTEDGLGDVHYYASTKFQP